LDGKNYPDKYKKIDVTKYEIDDVGLVVIFSKKIGVPVVVDYILIDDKSRTNQTDKKQRPAG
jgi:hypothetical protein